MKLVPQFLGLQSTLGRRQSTAAAAAADAAGCDHLSRLLTTRASSLDATVNILCSSRRLRIALLLQMLLFVGWVR